MSLSWLNYAFRQKTPYPTARLVYFYLASCANKDHDDECWPSLDMISEATMVCRRSVIDIVKELVELGLIAKKRGQHGCRYRMVFQPDSANPEVQPNCTSQTNPEVHPSASRSATKRIQKCSLIAPKRKERKRKEEARGRAQDFSSFGKRKNANQAQYDKPANGNGSEHVWQRIHGELDGYDQRYLNAIRKHDWTGFMAIHDKAIEIEMNDPGQGWRYVANEIAARTHTDQI